MLQQTTSIEAPNYTAPANFHDCLSGGPSALGMSTSASWLTCPTQSYLNSRRVRQKQDYVSTYDLSAASFGILFHALRGHRFVHGQESAERVLHRWHEQREITAGDVSKALMMLRVYNDQFPLELEPFTVLGVECDVYTNIHDWYGRPLFRSVRYDTVIRMKEDGAIFSLECKTASKGGLSALNPYIPQGWSHAALWNANASLVRLYGEMQGTVWDHCIKTAVPKCDRVGPRYWTKMQQSMALDYLRLPEAVQFPLLPDGTYPKFLHACWGKFSPCQYINLCHEDARGDYEVFDRETGEVSPFEG